MPAQETQEPQAQQMELPTAAQVNAEQPVRSSILPLDIRNGTSLTILQRPTEQMTAEPMSMRGGGGGGLCCGL